MGPAGTIVGQLFGRHDAENLVNETGQLRARSASALEGDLHDQMVANRTGHSECQHAADTGQRLVRFDGALVGRRGGHVHAYAYQAHGARLLGGIQSGRQISGVRQFR